MTFQDVIRFWFDETPEKKWFGTDPAFDRQIAERFPGLHSKACMGELFLWRDSFEGRLAEIIVLDQFSRNLFRQQARAFQQDAMALVLAQEAIRAGADKELPMKKRAFLYLPFMHSESLLIHDLAVELFSQPGLENNLEYEMMHKKIIERFGRYPHRNVILGRPSTHEEIQFLKEPNSSF
jgi:uncharacterized protein (DUF924 family)